MCPHGGSFSLGKPDGKVQRGETASDGRKEGRRVWAWRREKRDGPAMWEGAHRVAAGKGRTNSLVSYLQKNTERKRNAQGNLHVQK